MGKPSSWRWGSPPPRSSAKTCDRLAAISVCIAATAVIALVSGCGGSRPVRQTATEVPPAPRRIGGLYINVKLQNAENERIDLEGAISSTGRATGPGGATIVGLPCPHGRYLFTAEEIELPGTPRGTYSAHLTMGDATLPRGIMCDRPLPVSLGVAPFIIYIARRVHGIVERDFTIQGKRLVDGDLEGAVSNVEGTLCDGRYTFVAVLNTERRQLVFSYPFELTDVSGTPKPPTCP